MRAKGEHANRPRWVTIEPIRRQMMGTWESDERRRRPCGRRCAQLFVVQLLPTFQCFGRPVAHRSGFVNAMICSACRFRLLGSSSATAKIAWAKFGKVTKDFEPYLVEATGCLGSSPIASLGRSVALASRGSRLCKPAEPVISASEPRAVV